MGSRSFFSSIIITPSDVKIAERATVPDIGNDWPGLRVRKDMGVKKSYGLRITGPGSRYRPDPSIQVPSISVT